MQMDKELKKDINEYIEEVNQNIICDYKTKKKFVFDLKIPFMILLNVKIFFLLMRFTGILEHLSRLQRNFFRP